MKTSIKLMLILLFVSFGIPLNSHAQRGAITGIERLETTTIERAGERLPEISPQLTRQLEAIPENTAAKIAQSVEAQQAAQQMAAKETERFQQQLQRQQQEHAVRKTAEVNQSKIIEQARLDRENSVAIKRQQEEAATRKAAEDKARQESARLEQNRIAQKRMSEENAARTVQATKLPEKPLQAQASIAVESGTLNLQQQEIRKAAGDFSRLPTKAKEEVGYTLQQLEKQKGQMKALEEKAQADAAYVKRSREDTEFLEKKKLQDMAHKAAEANQRKVIERARLEKDSSIAVKRQQEESAAKQASEYKMQQEATRRAKQEMAQQAQQGGRKQSADFIVSSSGTAFPVPKGAQGPTPSVNPAGKQTGVAYTGGAGGENGQVTSMRVMNPTPPRGNNTGSPNGYVKYENQSGQGVNPYTGKTIPNTQSHFPIK
ncbi:MAG: hypothetical protein ACT4PN_08640 [Nitrospiraceae bacterium]